MRPEGIHFLQRLRAGARHTQYLLCSTPFEITTAAAASTSTGSARSSVLRLCRDHRWQRDLSAYAAAHMLQIRLCALPQPSSSTGGQQHGQNSNCNLVRSLHACPPLPCLSNAAGSWHELTFLCVSTATHYAHMMKWVCSNDHLRHDEPMSHYCTLLMHPCCYPAALNPMQCRSLLTMAGLPAT